MFEALLYIVYIRRGVVFLWYIHSYIMAIKKVEVWVDVEKGVLKFEVPHLTINMLVSFCLYVFFPCCDMVTFPMTTLSILLGLCICQKKLICFMIYILCM
jgi:hypothetical protein